MSPSPTCSRIATACLVALLWGQAKAAAKPAARPPLTPEIMADLEYQLQYAIKDHDSKRVTSLLAKGASPNPITEGGMSPLVQAIQMDDLPVFSILINAGANPKVLTEGNALSRSIILTDTYNPRDQIPILLVAAGNPNPQFALRLLQKGADPNESSHTITALFVAAASNHLETYQCIAKKANALSPEAQAEITSIASKNASFNLLQYFQSQSIPIDKQSLAIGICSAALRGDTLAVKRFLADGASLEAEAGSADSPILAAVRNQQLHMVQYLLANHVAVDPRDSEGMTPLLYATAHSDSAMVALLLANGANVSLANKRGRNALFEAQANCIPMLLKHKIDCNIVDDQGVSPLLYACSRKKWSLAEALLDAGADVALVSKKGETALSQTILNENYEFARQLVAKHAPLNLVPPQGSTILQTALTNTESTPGDIQWLLEQGADPSLPDAQHRTPAQAIAQRRNGDYMAMLLKFGAKGDFRSASTQIILAAVRQQDTALLAAALKRGCDIHADDTLKSTKQASDDRASFAMTFQPLVIQVIRDFNSEALAMLLANGANPNVVDDEGVPALLLAIQNYNYKAVKLLLEYKAQSDCIDSHGGGVVAYLARSSYGLRVPYPQMGQLFLNRVTK